MTGTSTHLHRRFEAAMDRLVEKHPLAGVMVRNRKAEIGGFAGQKRLECRYDS